MTDIDDILRTQITDSYRVHYRAMPWRDDFSPYRVLVSEVMLQQTQVDRVIPKFEQFVARFPGFESLGRAALEDVYAVWQGLGYNRGHAGSGTRPGLSAMIFAAGCRSSAKSLKHFPESAAHCWCHYGLRF
jgi:hypothetical protein